jgi:tetratricopeptide (TPR) repeat protein
MNVADRIDKSVFISYRRTNEIFALAVFQNLTGHGFDVFMDFKSIGSGDFEQVILANVRARAHFLVLLTPTALERCKDPEDWVRREIEAALDSRRNVVPLMLEGFDFGNPRISKRLTGKLAMLKRYNALMIPATYFDEAMDRLRERYLNVPLATVLHPASSSALQFAKDQRTAALNAPAVRENELAAEEWFERGFNIDEWDDRLRHFDEAIKLKPDYGAAYIFRGITRLRKEGNEEAAKDDILKGVGFQPNDAWAYFARGFVRQAIDREGAIADYDEAIRLEPGVFDFYVLRGDLRHDMGDLDGAQADYSEVIRIGPDDASYGYFKRGRVRADKSDFDGAIKDYTDAIRLDPNSAEAYIFRARARDDQGDCSGAIGDYDEAIRLAPNVAEVYYARGRARIGNNDIDGAMSDFEETIRLKPEFAIAYSARAVVLEFQERYDEAITDLEKHLALGGGVQNDDQAEVKKSIRTLSKKAGKPFWRRLW